VNLIDYAGNVQTGDDSILDCGEGLRLLLYAFLILDPRLEERIKPI